MSAAFTPGPWTRTVDHDLSLHGELEEGNRATIVSGSVVLFNPDRPEMAVIVADINSPNCWNDDLLEANARLIAAAPDLYEAAESAFCVLDATEYPEVVAKLSAALSKAREQGK